ncbi:SusD-like starch-binding protein associating with outer membrane [Anseongella ginsenosidimutans]|uniref:SusD-like starch-binding protein associating with outer membrane n=1 Tax=Anseongella ginsenosidimutans TaxID=496056 RepID=A0A4R3KM26_9SPHI|nr:SusD/RagB family nutrient-binding outer membrane lipoprotein [Anseongella ginsenosidimutans]QEC52535.1 SusD/RagB family nutrient-binding outer membrane lipoprotein [Anseongella ginsenosidimutans]TCS85281.1 SusD-like starch-binding protein associating with outer membrane [Anseongella ginsenosidimutans]
MKTILSNYILAGAVVSVLAAGCEKFGEINTNPNEPAKVSSSMLATTLILDITRDDISDTKSFMMHNAVDKYICWTEFPQAEQYNDFGRYGFGDLIVLNNIGKMVEFATDEQLRNSYAALGHFVRAWRFFQLTMRVGDIPYSQAIQGENSNIVKPEYDTQKQVFIGILNELDKADSLFAAGSDFEGDPIYGGAVGNWRKVVNTFQLKVLINLFRKTADPDLNVVNRFADIASSRPLFESNGDNFALVYSDQANQKYPYYKENNQFTIYDMVSSNLIDTLKAYDDYRLFYYANPSPVRVADGKAVSDWDAYVGVDPSIVYSSLSHIASSKDFSPVNDRYEQLPEGEPVSMLSYAQLQFILAEAAVRGWIPGSGESYYLEGIKGAMHFVEVNTPDDPQFHHNRPITDGYIQEYLTFPRVAFAATEEEQIKQIITQKYLANYLQSPYVSYFEYRRTGYPAFPINPASNLNTPTDRIPVRWMYPQNELDHNSANVAEAIGRQFNGNDNVNALMWILKD